MDSMTQYLNLPITNHTWVFFIVLAIILLAPMIFTKLRIPHLIGMILAGVLIGEHGLNILERDASFELFGQVGIYYIMFLAGLEMDLVGLQQNRSEGLIFGAFTAIFLIVYMIICAGMFRDYRVSDETTVLLEQQKDLSLAIDQLLEDIEAGRKYMKVYRQMKMYNDPSTNPVLYKK